MLSGVFQAKKKDGTIYYRSSFTYRNRHISLGSFDSEEKAHKAYTEALSLISSDTRIPEYSKDITLSFEKWVCIINFRDNNVYFSNPIYLKSNSFYYYLSENKVMTFDSDDLFYYARHKIQSRGGRLFVSDYGMQLTLQSRYGIKPYSISGKDHFFINGDELDYRYSNIKIVSRYTGVTTVFTPTQTESVKYEARIHIKGNWKIGTYDNEETAAIAYNKCADFLQSTGIKKKYGQNFIETLSAKKYADIYTSIDISDFIRKYQTNSK